MALILPRPGFFVKRRFVQRLQRCRQAGVRVRYLIILNVWNGRGARGIEKVLGVHNTTVYRVVKRFQEHGEAALWDGREDNGGEKLSEHFLAALDRVVRSNAEAHGWRRSTWTREMPFFVKTMVQHGTGRVRLPCGDHEPRPGSDSGTPSQPPVASVKCPWFPAVKTRLNKIRQLLATLPAHAAAVYEDEVDIHLNPKIGLDWMGLGQQKEAYTPGQNEKRYLAGAKDVRTGQIHWVESDKKNSWLFWDLLHKLTVVYAQAKEIHVILDNYGIHSSKIATVALANFASRVRLHFLPPYSPDENAIERVWQDLHANVTRNHTCATMLELMRNVRYYLRKRNRKSLRAVNMKSAA